MVLESARSHLKSLSKVATELNKASDAFTAELKVIESELAALNLGVQHEMNQPLSESDRHVRYEENRQTGEEYPVYSVTACYLGYRRHGFGAQWRLVVVQYEGVGDEHPEAPMRWSEIDVTPLLDSSRELRIAAAEQMPAFLESLREKAEKKLAALKTVSDAKK